jgi:hypothetical protein
VHCYCCGDVKCVLLEMIRRGNFSLFDHTESYPSWPNTKRSNKFIVKDEERNKLSC